MLNIAYQLYFIVQILKGKEERKSLGQFLKENNQTGRKDNMLHEWKYNCVYR